MAASDINTMARSLTDISVHDHILYIYIEDKCYTKFNRFITLIFCHGISCLSLVLGPVLNFITLFYQLLGTLHIQLF